MKLTMNHIIEGDEEVTICYKEMTEQIEAIAEIVRGHDRKIRACWEKQVLLLKPEEILYLESVDGVTFAYLKDKLAKVDKSLAELAILYDRRGFFRCSKSMILNVYKISYLKSEPGNRIRATMENNEQVMISRRYAKQLRQLLKGETDSEEE